MLSVTATESLCLLLCKLNLRSFLSLSLEDGFSTLGMACKEDALKMYLGGSIQTKDQTQEKQRHSVILSKAEHWFGSSKASRNMLCRQQIKPARKGSNWVVCVQRRSHGKSQRKQGNSVTEKGCFAGGGDYFALKDEISNKVWGREVLKCVGSECKTNAVALTLIKLNQDTKVSSWSVSWSGFNWIAFPF